MRVERGEAHEEERKHEKDEDKPPECVNHTHGQRDGEGAHKKKNNIKVPKTGVSLVGLVFVNCNCLDNCH